MYNKGKIKVEPTSKKDSSPWSKDILVDPAGQWKFPGQVTKIPSNRITMRNVPYPVMGIDNLGNQQMMMPEGEYQFPGNMVTEYPMMQDGGELAYGQPKMEQFDTSFAKNLRSAIKKYNAKNKTNNPDIETEEVITGYQQQWNGAKWVQTPVIESIPHRSINKKQTTMRLPNGYHVMPDGSLMSDEEYRCGGGIRHMQSGGEGRASYDPATGNYIAPDLPTFNMVDNGPYLRNAMADTQSTFARNAMRAMSAPQMAAMELVTGKQQYPSEAWGYDNPQGFWQNAANIGMDMVLDPSNLAGGANIIRGGLMKGGVKTAKAGAKKLAKETAQGLDDINYNELMSQFAEQVALRDNGMPQHVYNKMNAAMINKLNRNIPMNNFMINKAAGQIGAAEIIPDRIAHLNLLKDADLSRRIGLEGFSDPNMQAINELDLTKPFKAINAVNLRHLPLIPNQFGGTANAPQNATIDSIGQTKTNVMKNYLSANLYGSLLSQEEQRLNNEIQQYLQDGGSTYDPNMYNQMGYANAISATRKQHSKDRGAFWNALEDVAASYGQPQVGQPMQQNIQQPIDSFTPNTNAIPNQGFGSNQPDTFGRNVDRSFGQNAPVQRNPFMQGGGQNNAVPDFYTMNQQEVARQQQMGNVANQYGIKGPLRQQPETPWYTKAIDKFNEFDNSVGSAPAKPTVGNWYDPVVGMFDAWENSIGSTPPPAAPVNKFVAQQAVSQPVRDPNIGAPKVASPAKVTSSAPVATQKKAAESTVGKTPAEVKEIEAAKKEVANTPVVTTQEPAKQRGNVTKDDVATASTNKTNASTTVNTNQAYYPGYGGGRFKMKGVDPTTGKRFKIKYDTAQSPRDFYGGRGPRVVKYDIYNNPVYAQPNAANQVNNQADIANQNSIPTPYVQPYDLPNYQIDPNNRPIYPQQNQGQMMYPGSGVMKNMPDPYVEFRNQEPMVDASTLQVSPEVGQFSNFRRETPTRDRNDRRFQKQVERDIRRGFQGGGQFDMNGLDNAPSNFDPSFTSTANVGDSAYASGPESGSYVNEQGQLVTYGNQNQQPDMKAKWKGNGQGMNQWAPMLIPGVNMISSIFEQGDVAANEARLQDLKQASNSFTPNQGMNRGKNTANAGYFDPYNQTPVQFAGNNQGMINSSNVFAQYGGPQTMVQDNTRTLPPDLSRAYEVDPTDVSYRQTDQRQGYYNSPDNLAANENILELSKSINEWSDDRVRLQQDRENVAEFNARMLPEVRSRYYREKQKTFKHSPQGLIKNEQWIPQYKAPAFPDQNFQYQTGGESEMTIPDVMSFSRNMMAAGEQGRQNPNTIASTYNDLNNLSEKDRARVMSFISSPEGSKLLQSDIYNRTGNFSPFNPFNVSQQNRQRAERNRTYQMGGEYDLTEEEIADIIAAGGQIQYL